MRGAPTWCGHTGPALTTTIRQRCCYGCSQCKAGRLGVFLGSTESEAPRRYDEGETATAHQLALRGGSRADPGGHVDRGRGHHAGDVVASHAVGLPASAGSPQRADFPLRELVTDAIPSRAGGLDVSGATPSGLPLRAFGAISASSRRPQADTSSSTGAQPEPLTAPPKKHALAEPGDCKAAPRTASPARGLFLCAFPP